MPVSAPSRYRFGPFTLEPAERRLLRDGAPVDLTPKALDVLTALVERHGHLVTKDELLETVWPDVVVDENTLSVNVSRLRSALGETAQQGRYIETVPRSGYRFVSDIEAAPLTEVVEETTLTRRTRALVRVEQREGARWMPLLLGGAVALAGVGVALGAQNTSPDEAVAPARFPGTPASVSAVAPAPEAARAVPAPSQRALARAAYGRGRALWWTRQPVPPGTIGPTDEFRVALQHDPTFAEAYVGLAACYAFGYATAREVYPLLEQALALDPDLSGAYAVRGFTRMMHEWDWAGGEADLRHALALDPSDVSALQWLASLRMIQRRPEEADALLQRALAVAPPEARASLLADRTQALYYAGAYEEAVAAFRHSRALDPEFGMGMSYAAMALLYLDRPEAAAAFSGALASVTPAMHGRLQTAAEDGTEALVRELLPIPDPTASLYAPLARARLHAFLGDSEAALDQLERALVVRDFMLPFHNADPALESLRDEPRFVALLQSMGLNPGAEAAPRRSSTP